MKIEDSINKVKDKSKPVIIAVFIGIICTLILFVVGFIQIYFEMSSLGTFISSIVLLILFVLVGKLIFNVNYKELYIEIKLSKDSYIDKLFFTIFFSLIYAAITIFIYQINFTINPDKAVLISDFIGDVSNDNTNVSNYYLLLSSIAFIIVVLAEEIFFRFTLYKVFVKKKEHVIIFIILSSIIFALYHGYSVARILASLTLGVFLSIIYVMTKSVVYTFISHMIWNSSTYISSFFMIYFKNINVSISVLSCLVAIIMMICLLIAVSIYSYCKRGYIIPLKATKDRNDSLI